MTLRLLLALSLLLIGCPPLDANDDDSVAPPDDDDDDTSGETWSGLHIGENNDDLLVTIGVRSTRTEPDGTWEINAPSSTPAQVDVYASPTYVQTRVACASGIETGSNSTFPDFPDEQPTVTLRLTDWVDADGVAARIYYTDEATGYFGSTRLGPEDFFAGADGTLLATVEVEAADQWSARAWSREGGALNLFAQSEPGGPLAPGDSRDITLSLSADLITRVAWDGLAPSDAENVSLYQYVDLLGRGPSVPLWTGPPPGADTDIPLLTGLDEEVRVGATVTLAPRPGCPLPSSRVPVDWAPDTPLTLPPLLAPPLVEPVGGAWTPDLSLDMSSFAESAAERTGFSMIVFSNSFQLWSALMEQSCASDTMDFPSELPEVSPGDQYSLNLWAESAEPGSSSCRVEGTIQPN
ncbi:MAG: hypothetical protein KDA24_17165 [Deltaproteobacteria bacterium]|nr:hypothetical protein [Deltaproteobacteria bacterium]